jgi:DNA-binding NarL/FixJ family response regulator
MKIVVVDDHDLLRVGLRDLLARSPGCEVVGDARTARAAFQVIASAKPDVVLMDIALPGMDGVVATREILRRTPDIRVVILSAHDQPQDVIDAIDAGALAYTLKTDPPDILMQALQHAVRGVRYLTPSLEAIVASPQTTPRIGGLLDALSEREREVFRLAADCMTSPEIARELCLARKTVDTHLNRINRKLSLRDRAALVRLAAELGLVHSVRRREPGSPPETSVAPALAVRAAPKRASRAAVPLAPDARPARYATGA